MSPLTDSQQHGARLSELLGLAHPPVAVAFLPEPPPGVSRVAASAPAGCSYWRRATAGEVFYTEAADHLGCTIGAHTHNVTMPPEKAAELQSMVGTMVGLGYLAMAEVPGLPRRAEAFGVAVYAPAAKTPCPPDVVLVRGGARQMMLLAEAARAAGIGHEGATLGRPACAMIPAALAAGRANTSLGCIGNRVYTGLGDDELYVTIPGARLGDVVEALATIVRANEELERFHRARL